MEFMTFFGFLLSFLALSTSRYKLPHYIFPLFPFIAIITADYICHLTSMAVKRYYDYLKNAQYVVLLLLFSLISLIFIYFFPPQSYWLPIVIALLFVLVIILIKNLTDKSDKIIIPTVLASVAVGLVMGLNFYPSILQYQSDSVLGKEIYKNQVPNDRLKYYREHSNSLDFYAHRNVFNVDSTIMNDYKRGMLVHTDQKGKDYIIKEQKMDYKVIRIYEDFPVTRLNINFLKKTTRQSQVQRTYLLEKI